MQIRNFIILFNLAFSAMIVYLKILVGNSYTYLMKVYSVEGLDSVIKEKMLTNADGLSLSLSILAIISFFLSFLLLKEKMGNQAIERLNVLLAVVSVVLTFIKF